MQCCRIRACHQYAYSVFPPSPSSNRSLNFSLPRASSSISLSRCRLYFCTILESWSLFLPALVSQCCLRPAFIFTIWGCTLWAKEDFWLDCTLQRCHKALQSLVIPAGPCPGWLSSKSEEIFSASLKVTDSVLTLRCITPDSNAFINCFSALWL